MSDGGIQRDRVDGHPNVILLTLDRPPVNALGHETYAALERAFVELDDDPSVHCIVFTGAGRRAFCAGADLRDLDGFGIDNGQAFQRVRTRTFATMLECSVPIIGAVNGPALGAGLVLASLCDLLVASSLASFGLPEVDVGVLGGASHVSRLIPGPCLRRMTLTGERLSAEKLVQLGGLSEVVEPDALLDAAFEVADLIAAKSSRVVRMTKSAMSTIEHPDLHRGHRIEQAHMLALKGRGEAGSARP